MAGTIRSRTNVQGITGRTGQQKGVQRIGLVTNATLFKKTYLIHMRAIMAAINIVGTVVNTRGSQTTCPWQCAGKNQSGHVPTKRGSKDRTNPQERGTRCRLVNWRTLVQRQWSMAARGCERRRSRKAPSRDRIQGAFGGYATLW